MVINLEDRLVGARKSHAPQQLGSLKRERVHVFGGSAVHSPLASKSGALGLSFGRGLFEDAGTRRAIHKKEYYRCSPSTSNARWASLAPRNVR